ncbi:MULTISPECIES: GntR family transcriptional regulator [unclassified Ruminococcus]|uniref:GntR family transcriptional regulator n=1 Tax=unclassified Ruminococcus TaxID=2608920 RepID=UPI00319E7DCA
MAIKYKWLIEQLREIISDSIQKGINKLPTEQELAVRYRVSRQTVRAALAVLEDEREIRRIKGSGAYITGLSSLEDRNIVGILIPDEQQYEYPALINDIRVALAAEGFSCKVYPTHNHVDLERQILQFLLKSPLRALIVEPVKSALPSPNTELYQRLIQKGTSILFLGCAYPQLSQIPVIHEDNLYGAGLLVQSLVEKGHSSIAGIFQMDDQRGHERYQGFLDAMQNQGLTVPDRNICWYTTQELDDFRQSRDISFLKKFLERITPDCTAFICEDDFIAWLLWEELSLGNTLALKREKRIATHAPLSSSLQNTGFTAASAIHSFEPTIALAAFNTSYLTTSGLLRATTLTHSAHQPGTLAAQMSISKLKGLPVSSQEVPWQLSLPKSHN